MLKIYSDLQAHNAFFYRVKLQSVTDYKLNLVSKGNEDSVRFVARQTTPSNRFDLPVEEIRKIGHIVTVERNNELPWHVLG